MLKLWWLDPDLKLTGSVVDMEGNKEKRVHFCFERRSPQLDGQNGQR